MFNPACIKVEFVPAETFESAYIHRIEQYLDRLSIRWNATEDADTRKHIEATAADVQQEFVQQKPVLEKIAAQPKGTNLFFIELGRDRIADVAPDAFQGKEGFHDFSMNALQLRYVVAPMNDENFKTLAEAHALGEDMVRSYTRKATGHAAALEQETAPAGPAAKAL